MRLQQERYCTKNETLFHFFIISFLRISWLHGCFPGAVFNNKQKVGVLGRLLRKRFRIERERGGSAISTGIEPELFDHLPGRETGIKLAKILSRPRVQLDLLFLSKLALSMTLILRHFMSYNAERKQTLPAGHRAD